MHWLCFFVLNIRKRHRRHSPLSSTLQLVADISSPIDENELIVLTINTHLHSHSANRLDFFCIEPAIMRYYNFYILVSATLFMPTTSELTCFWPDGKNATGLIPCKPDADVSHCCRDADMCLTNGMCISSGLSSPVRRGCTDKTWKSPDCPNVCNIGKLRCLVSSWSA